MICAKEKETQKHNLCKLRINNLCCNLNIANGERKCNKKYKDKCPMSFCMNTKFIKTKSSNNKHKSIAYHKRIRTSRKQGDKIKIPTCKWEKSSILNIKPMPGIFTLHQSCIKIYIIGIHKWHTRFINDTKYIYSNKKPIQYVPNITT